MSGGPIIVLNKNIKREQGNKVQRGNIQAAKTIADVIRTSLGPQAMLKMLMDPMGGIVMTNDGNAILREITVKHPAAKSMIEISRTQDEETGDGTTSVIVLAGEVMASAQPFLEQGIHPTVIIQGYRLALEDIIVWCKDKLSKKVNVDNNKDLEDVVRSCLGTKMMSRWMDMAIDVSIRAVKTVTTEEFGRKEADIKRYVRIEKIPGGTVEDTHLMMGVILNKDITHSKMRRRVEKPRIVLLDCNLEYKKGESQTAMEISKEEDFTRALQMEEASIKAMCDKIISVKPDVIFTEKGVSDLAQHFLMKANITAIRRLKKTDNNRLAKASSARIVSEIDDLKPEDVGTRAGLFEIKKIGDEYYTLVTECQDSKACTVVIRGASKDIMNEVERNLHDSMCVVRNIILHPHMMPGGGASEMALAKLITDNAANVTGMRHWAYAGIARALEVIPRTLIQNCGGNTIRQLTALRAKHAESSDNWTWGVDGKTGNLVDMNQYGVWDPLAVKLQVYKTAIETAVMLLRIDDILSGTKKADGSDRDGPVNQIDQSQMQSGPGMTD